MTLLQSVYITGIKVVSFAVKKTKQMAMRADDCNGNDPDCRIVAGGRSKCAPPKVCQNCQFNVAVEGVSRFQH